MGVSVNCRFWSYLLEKLKFLTVQVYIAKACLGLNFNIFYFAHLKITVALDW